MEKKIEINLTIRGLIFVDGLDLSVGKLSRLGNVIIFGYLENVVSDFHIGEFQSFVHV